MSDERLAALIGDWTGEEALAASPWAPAGPARGRLAFREALGGAALTLDYAEERDGTVALTGFGLLVVEGLSWWWFDSLGARPDGPGRGAWVSDALVLERVTPRGTNRTTLRLDGDVLEQRIAVRLAGEDTFAELVVGRYDNRRP
jgi:hypothetical protein